MDKYKLSEWTHSTVIDRTDGDVVVQIYRLNDGSDCRCKVVGDDSGRKWAYINADVFAMCETAFWTLKNHQGDAPDTDNYLGKKMDVVWSIMIAHCGMGYWHECRMGV